MQSTALLDPVVADRLCESCGIGPQLLRVTFPDGVSFDTCRPCAVDAYDTARDSGALLYVAGVR